MNEAKTGPITNRVKLKIFLDLLIKLLNKQLLFSDQNLIQAPSSFIQATNFGKQRNRQMEEPMKVHLEIGWYPFPSKIVHIFTVNQPIHKVYHSCDICKDFCHTQTKLTISDHLILIPDDQIGI